MLVDGSIPVVEKSRQEVEKEEKSRGQALEFALAQIKKKCGPGSIMRLGTEHTAKVDVISTGSLSLDLALGVGGLPRGRVIEIFGPESSGKTTLALHVIANAQKTNGTAALIDAEHAFDPQYGRHLGVNLDNLLVSQPDCGEQALDICEMLVTSNAVDVVVIDSVAALVPRSELNGEMGDATMGVQARLMSQALRKLTGAISRSNTCVIFINQIREKIGVMFGSPETTTGGRALKFYSSVRIDIRRIGAIKDGEEVVGNRTIGKVVKNKLAPPFKNAEFDILYGKGISWTGDVLDLAAEMGVVQKNGTWFAFGDEKIGQGRERTVQYLEENPEILKKIEKDLMPRLFNHEKPAENGAAPAAPVAAPEDAKNAKPAVPVAPPARPAAPVHVPAKGPQPGSPKGTGDGNGQAADRMGALVGAGAGKDGKGFARK